VAGFAPSGAATGAASGERVHPGYVVEQEGWRAARVVRSA